MYYLKKVWWHQMVEKGSIAISQRRGMTTLHFLVKSPFRLGRNTTSIEGCVVKN